MKVKVITDLGVPVLSPNRVALGNVYDCDVELARQLIAGGFVEAVDIMPEPEPPVIEHREPEIEHRDPAPKIKRSRKTNQ